MSPHLFSITALLFLLLPVFGSAAAASGSHHGSLARRHNHLYNRLNVRDVPPVSNLAPVKLASTPRTRRSCLKKPQGSTTTNSTSTFNNTIAAKPTAVKSASVHKSSATPPTSASGKVANMGVAGTQAGAAPASQRTSPADPYLMELSKPYNNANNPIFTQVHTGQMTYYDQGLGACGDTYDDNSFTAAVSKLMYDTWPGATQARNRNPICGPYVTGRRIINQAGAFVTAVPGSQYIDLGGDGLPNCSADSQCHVPLTATVKHGDKSIQVKIVDRCEACAFGDIDLTPTAFAALADMGLGRTSVEWFFNP